MSKVVQKLKPMNELKIQFNTINRQYKMLYFKSVTCINLRLRYYNNLHTYSYFEA